MLSRRAVAGGLLAAAVLPSQALGQAASLAQDAEYHLSAGDQLRITVFGQADLTGLFPISTNGNISFPLIGDLPAEGHTTTELGAALAERLREGFVRDPNVSVEVATYRPFYILGEVTRPGNYPYSPHMTVHNAVATAGGFTARANRRRVYIKRATDEGERSYRLASDTPIAPGDTIRIGERWF